MTYTPPSGDAADFPLVAYTSPTGDAANFELASAVFHLLSLGIMVRGKLGEAGEPDPLGVKGIYQARMTKRGKVPVKMRFYRPTNPQTVPQEANRAKFAAAMSAWQALTSDEKAAYTERAKRRGMFGWGLFIRDYFQNN